MAQVVDRLTQPWGARVVSDLIAGTRQLYPSAAPSDRPSGRL